MTHLLGGLAATDCAPPLCSQSVLQRRPDRPSQAVGSGSSPRLTVCWYRLHSCWSRQRIDDHLGIPQSLRGGDVGTGGLLTDGGKATASDKARGLIGWQRTCDLCALSVRVRASVLSGLLGRAPCGLQGTRACYHWHVRCLGAGRRTGNARAIRAARLPHARSSDKVADPSQKQKQASRTTGDRLGALHNVGRWGLPIRRVRGSGNRSGPHWVESAPSGPALCPS